MGITNSKWYLYSRDAESNSWNRDPLYIYDTLNMGIFKHQAYRFALQETAALRSYKAIYLYNNSTRYVKVELLKPSYDTYFQLFLEFKDESVLKEWDMCTEVSDALFSKENKFKNHYVPLDSDKCWIKRWQLIKPLPNTQPGMPKLSLTQYITSTLYNK